MPSPTAVRFELALYVERDKAELVRELMNRPDDSCLLLEMEKLVGQRMEDPDGRVYPLIKTVAEYGEGVSEVYWESTD